MWLHDRLAALVPERCPRCRGPTRRGFCLGCAADFARIAAPCPVCALPQPVARCPKNLGAWHLRGIVAPYRYAPPLYRQLLALKFRGGRAFGRAFGLLLAPDIVRAGAEVDALIAVPLHPARLRERGYNQAGEIARILSAETGIAVISRAARRARPTMAQSTLRPLERRANVAGAFEAHASCRGLRIAVVDDVVTTAATVNALAAALLSAGAASVEAFAVARTLELEPRRR